MDKERTSILLEKDVMLKLKTLAKTTNKSTSFIIREAVTEYVTKKTPKKKFNIIGIVNSGDTHFAENDEEYLKNNFGKD
jgi:metal-responsive CopG/Arc/MetJ family transcriptional regulator